MAKKLLSWNFSNGHTSINIGANTNSDGIKKDKVTRFSDTDPLNKVGALVIEIYNPFYYGDNKIYSERQTSAFKNAGYGSRVITPSVIGINAPMYFNGDPSASYIFYKSNDGNSVDLYYHDVNTGEEGYLFKPSATADRFGRMIFCGEIYDDGTFTGIELYNSIYDYGDRNLNKVYDRWITKCSVLVFQSCTTNLYSVCKGFFDVSACCIKNKVLVSEFFKSCCCII